MESEYRFMETMQIKEKKVQKIVYTHVRQSEKV